MPFISYFILISVLIGNFSYFVLRRLRFFALMSELPQVAHTSAIVCTLEFPHWKPTTSFFEKLYRRY